MINVNDFKRDFYSCGGEDGIIDFLLKQINQTGFVIEFGAADGFHCSNTARLWKDRKTHSALLIESDANHFQELVKNMAGTDNVVTEHALVVNVDDHTRNIADVCSIDVDGNDWEIAYRMQVPHQIVVVEYNPTVPPHMEMIGIENLMYGSSALSITNMMEGKGYTLVAVTKTNLVFLYGDHRDKFVSDLPTLFDYSSLNYVVTSYDGVYEMVGEFGYGLSRPGDLRVKTTGLEKRMTIDSVTREYMRQMLALDDAKGNP